MVVQLKTFITCCLFITTIAVKAQQMLPSDVPTPNAASLGMYGDVPVSYYTGRPNVKIPIYALKVRDFSLSISLSYDTGGILVNSLPTWVGQNWTLNAGGVITRTVQGRYDEWIYPTQTNYDNTKNYFQSLGEMTKLLSSSKNSYAELKKDVTYGLHDLAPDIYTFNFCGKTGEFFLDNDGNWRVLSDENLEVLFDYADGGNFISPFIATYPYKQAIDNKQPKTIKGFIIRDAEGNAYEFGMDINAIDFTTNIWHMSKNEQNESWHAMSWYLTKITDKYGNELVKFDYRRGVYIIQAYNSFEYNHVKEKGSSGFFGHYGQEYSGSNDRFPYGLTISSPVYLTKITGANGVVVNFNSDNSLELATENIYKSLYRKAGGINSLYDLMASMVSDWKPMNGTGYYSEGAFYYLQSDDTGLSTYRYNPIRENKLDILRYSRVRQLNMITISSAINTYGTYCTKAYRFLYGYVNNRMFLDSIRIQGDIKYLSDATIGYYRFKYQDKEKLPNDYLTTAIDHWGYYNGNPYSIPTDGKYARFKNIRNPSFQCTLAGSLSELEYPTGGVSVFEYEPNTYSTYQADDRQTVINENGTGGGLRIKSITEFDSPSHNKMHKKRTFEYTIPGTNVSSGELFATPKYYWQKWNAWCVDNDAKHEVETFRTSSIIPLSNSFGPSLGYSYVTENIIDLEKPLQKMKKIVYRYSNLSDAGMKDEPFALSFSHGLPSPEDKFSERGFKRGKLISQTSYDGANKKTETITYNYRNDNGLNTQYTYTSNLVYGNNGCSASFGYYGGGIYKLYYPLYDVVEKVDSVFYDHSKIVTSTLYTKNDKTFTSELPYKHSASARLVSSEQVIRGNDIFEKRYSYGDLSDNSLSTQLHRDFYYLEPQEEQSYRNSVFCGKKTTCYTLTNNKLIVPSMIVKTYSTGQKDTLVTYSDYTVTGRSQAYKELGKPKVYLKWGYNDNYLLLKGNRYIPLVFSADEMFNEQRCLNKECQFIKGTGDVMGYVYHPVIGVLDIVYPNGYIQKYKYDRFGRLMGIYDINGNLINSYEYNYRKE